MYQPLHRLFWYSNPWRIRKLNPQLQWIVNKICNYKSSNRKCQKKVSKNHKETIGHASKIWIFFIDIALKYPDKPWIMKMIFTTSIYSSTSNHSTATLSYAIVSFLHRKQSFASIPSVWSLPKKSCLEIVKSQDEHGYWYRRSLEKTWQRQVFLIEMWIHQKERQIPKKAVNNGKKFKM